LPQKTIATQLLEKAGVDVNKLVDLIVRNAAAELTMSYYHAILRANLIGPYIGGFPTAGC
jgi:ferritin-like protein